MRVNFYFYHYVKITPCAGAQQCIYVLNDMMLYVIGKQQHRLKMPYTLVLSSPAVKSKSLTSSQP
ncbi:MAG: hypothetical protein AB8U44_01340 [Aaplasma endosymbiont of Hyalomma asiaticum]